MIIIRPVLSCQCESSVSSVSSGT